MIRGAILVVAALACGSCATSQKSSMEALQDSIEGYHHAYRWKNYERAATYMPSDLRAAFIATYENDANALHIEDFQILRVDFQGEDAARVVVRLRYMMLPSVIVENRNLVQSWHKVADVWTLESEDNPLKKIDPTAGGGDPSSFGGGQDVKSNADSFDIEVVDPQGKVIRREGAQPVPDELPPDPID